MQVLGKQSFSRAQSEVGQEQHHEYIEREASVVRKSCEYSPYLKTKEQFFEIHYE